MSHGTRQAVAGATLFALLLSSFPAGFVFAATTTTLLPNGQGTYTAWVGDEDDIDDGIGSEDCEDGSDGSDNVSGNTTGDRESVNIDLTSIPNGATITSVDVSVTYRNGNNGGADDGTFQTFTRLNGTDLDSGVNLVATNTTCTPGSQTINVADTVKSGATTLQVGVLKTATDTSEVWVGTLRATVTFDMDGLDTMEVSPTSVGANTTGNSFTFTFDNDTGADFSAGSMVRLTVPAGWSDPTGNISVTDIGGSGCSPDTTPTISGTGPWTVDVTHTCTDGNGFEIDYTNVTAPSTVGVHEFTTLTQDGASTLTAIASQPTVTVNATHLIDTTTGVGGTITPGDTYVTNGDDQTFIIAPSTGNIVSSVSVDAVAQPTRINTYTFSSVTGAHTIEASFEDSWNQPSDTDNSSGVTADTNAYSSNNSYAVFDNSADVTDYDDFSIPSIPVGATINGIQVALEGNRTSGRTLDVSLTWDEGSTWTTAQNVSSFTSTDSTIIAGGTGDLWGRAWNASEFTNSAFKVRTDATTGGGNINLDQIQVKVSYTPDTTAPSGGSVSYTDGFYTTLSVPVTYTTGSDGESGLNLASGKVQRATATLTDGTCGVFGSFGDVATESDGSYTDASVLSNNCYIYQYVISDNAGNEATYNTANVAKVDAEAPTPVMSSVASNPTNLNPIVVTVAFLESVTGFDDTDITPVGATVGNFSGTGNAYSFELTPTGDPVTITANIAASAATDTAGNNSIAATQFSRTYNSTALSVTVNSGPADGSLITTNTPAFGFTTDGDTAECSIDGGSTYAACTTFTAPSGTQDFTGSPLAEGDHTFQVKVSAVGMDDVTSAPRTFTIDTIVPSVALTSAASPGPVAAPFSVTATFSEDVTGFDLTDILGSVVNATLSNFLQVTPSVYTFDVTPTANGLVTVDVPAAVAQDVAAHDNTAAPQFSITYYFVTTSSDTLVVSPFGFNGWDIMNYDDGVAADIGSATTTSGTGGYFVTGAATPPIGSGSFKQEVGTNGNDATRLRTFAYDGILLSDIESLGYSTFVETTGGQATYLQLRIDHDNDGDMDDALFFEPVYQTGGYGMLGYSPGAVPDQCTGIVNCVDQNTWQTWNALTGGWWSNNDSAGGPPLTTLENYATQYPGARLINNPGTDGPALRLQSGFGAGAWDNFRGNVDNFIIGVQSGFNIHTETFNFEPDATAPVIAEVTPIGNTTDTTPDYTFSTDEAGTVLYGGACSSVTTAAAVGNNTVELGALAVGTYNDCTVTVTDSYGNVSNLLTMSSFTIEAPAPAPTNTGGGGGGGGQIVGSGPGAPGNQTTNPGVVAGASTDTGTNNTNTTPTPTDTGIPTGGADTGTPNTGNAGNAGGEIETGIIGGGEDTETPVVTEEDNSSQAAAVAATGLNIPLWVWLGALFAALFSFLYWLWNTFKKA